MAYKELLKTYEKWEDRIQHHGIGEMPFCIAFCGVFSSGKSSLLNALLGCGNVLPTGINPVTKIITRIRYGKKQSLKCISNGKEVSIPDSLMKDTIIGKRPMPHGCTEIILELPAKILKNNVEFIDTPGYEDNSALEDMSRAAVLTADLIVFCCNCTMLGKQFEKQYLDELRLTHGNFCMVANRMDSLNTEEDIENVRRTAQRLMNGRGNAAHPENKQGQFFLTIAAGPYTKIPGFDHMNGFDRYIQRLTEDQKERRQIRQSTNACFTCYYADRLRSGIKEERAGCKAELKRLQSADAAAKEKLALQDKVNRIKLENKIENAKLYGSSLVRPRKNSIENKIRNLNSPSTFVESVKNIIQSEVENLISNLAGYSLKNGLMTITKVRSELKQYLQCTVPSPNWRFVQRRGVLGRAFHTLTDFVENGYFELDDGKDVVYGDYKTPAISKANEHLENFLQKWNRLLNDLKTQQCDQSTAFTPNPRIAEIQAEIGKLAELEEKMQSQERLLSVLEAQTDPFKTAGYIDEEIGRFYKSIMQLPTISNVSRSLKDMWDSWKNGSIKVVFEGGYACGKRSLISAVSGAADICSGIRPDSLPFSIIPCQPEEKVVIFNQRERKRTEMRYGEYLASQYDRLYNPDEEVLFYTKEKGLGTPWITLVDNYVYNEFGNEVIRRNRRQASALVFVVTALRGFGQDDRLFFKDLYERCENLFVAYTMTDAARDEGKEECKKQIEQIISQTGRGYSKKFMEERVFFTDPYSERQALKGEDVIIDGKRIPAKMVKTGIPELRTALKEYVLDTKEVFWSAYPVFKYMCQIYGTLLQRFGCENTPLSMAYSSLNNLHMCMFGVPLTERRRAEIANGQ